MKIFKIILVCLVIFFFLTPPLLAAEQGWVEKTIGGYPPCFKTGAAYKDCSLDDFLRLFVGISRLILGLAGSLALLMLMIAGFWFLTSGGSSDRVNKGRQAFLNAVIGLLIVFLAWIIVNFVIAILVCPGQQSFGGCLKKVQIFGKDWWSTSSTGTSTSK